MNRAQLTEECCTVLANEKVGPRLYRIVLASKEISRALLPGQFVHMQIPGMEAHILRRPFSVYQCDAAQGYMVVLYQVVGFGTEEMTQLCEGDACSVIGPIGNGWAPSPEGDALLVGGGVGSAPLFLLAQHLCSTKRMVTIVLGAQTKDALVCLDDYEQLAGVEVIPATDDGSFGHAGFCTEPASQAIQKGNYRYVACCGPEPLMRSVAGMALEAHAFCEVSLERRMACGVGACLSCVVDTAEGKKRACVDGPIFDASKVVW